MGGCATKPKGLKPEAVDAPAPEPTPVKEEEEEAATVSETKGEIIEAVKKVEGDNDDGEKVDEQGNKRRSLSLLFKENEEGKESTEDDKMPSEPRKEAPPETEKTTEESKQTPAPDVVHESKTDESEQTPTPEVAKAAPATEIRKPESSEEKKTEEEVEGEGNAAKNVKV